MDEEKLAVYGAISSSPEWSSPITAKHMYMQDDDHSTSHHGSLNDEEIPHSDTMDKGGSLRGLASSLVREDYTWEFFRPLQEAEASVRMSAVESIVDMLTESLKSEKKELVKVHLGTIVRLANEVPFDDIMEAFQKLCKVIEQHGIVLPKARTRPSYFIPKSTFAPINTPDPTYRELFVELFIQTGRISHANQVLLIHPSYFDKYFMAYNLVMREMGPLPVDWRQYIAILAASRHQCKWVVFLHEVEFQSVGGELEWLKGIDHIPKKLQNLLELIQIISHQPWLLTRDHIAALVKGEESWTIAELVHAMVIVCNTKMLCGIVYGCGVTPETDMPDIPTNDHEPLIEEEVNTTVKAETNKLMELLKGWDSYDNSDQTQDHFVTAESVEQESRPAARLEHSDLTKYIGKFIMKHQDFDVKAKSYSIFRVQDYCWKEHGFELVRRFLPDVATLLDEEFDFIYTMTYNMFSQNKDIDTFPFRRSIWQYVQRVKGMFHDDYNYQEVNVFLNKESKKYIKKIACEPETLTRSDFANMGYDLKPDEIVHVAALAVESSKQSEILYGLNVIWQHMYDR